MESYEDRKRAWEDMEVSHEELKQLTECMKKPEFRELLREYAEEVSDPKNRQLYESEITQLERERGVDVTFVHPEPGYVIKTSLDGKIKCFINVGQSNLVEKPSSKIADEKKPAAGLNWSIPHILAPPRDDLDKSKTRCRVFDVVFHPDALYLAKRNPGFKRILNDTALDGVENSFKVKLDRKNLRFPKMNFKGVSQPTVIRKPCEKPTEKLDIEPEIYQKLMSGYDELRERHMKPKEEKAKRPAPTTIRYSNSRDNETDKPDSDYTTPKFLVKHQSYLDMDEFRETREAKMLVTVPKNLVIDINLPLLKSANDATLDVQERHLSLKSESPAKYHLELPLSYRVDPDHGNAKFDAKQKKLTVTLPVVPDVSTLADGKEDSGVESDHGSPLPESQMSNGDKLIRENSNDSQQSSEPLVCDLSEEGIEVHSDCADTALRTSDDEKFDVPFMDPAVKYSLPTFTCNVYDNVLAITIHAKNVDSESIRHRILEDNSGLHVLLTSIGAGYFPAYYSLCLKLGSDVVIPESLVVEPWDNNVVISVKVRCAETLARYLAGINEDSLEIKDLTAAASIKNKLQALEEDPGLETDKNVEVIRSDGEVIVNVNVSDRVSTQSAYTDDDDDEHDRESISQGEERKRNFAQSRSISESSGDELPSSIGSANGSVRYKSILKSRHFSRSVSESSIDYDSAAQLSSVTFNDSVHELMSESEGSSLKKTVRFNDVVSRQLYRSNSSILGQRKKNQRKLRNKKRAHERRMSESENSETEDREKYKVESKKEIERDTSDAVRPILHQSNNKSSTETAVIEIERSPRGCNNKRKQKRNLEGKIDVDKNDEKAKTESHSEEESFDTKNDLMFDLEV